MGLGRHYLGILETLSIPRERIPDFLATFVLLMIVRWQALVQYTYSVDDYKTLIEGGVNTDQFLGQSRFVLAAINELTSFLDLNFASAPVATIGLSSALASWMAVKVVHLWLPQVKMGVLLTAGALTFAHPYTAELFTFRGVTPLHYVAYAASVAALLLALRPNVANLAIATLLLFLALGTYQVALNVYIVLTVLTFVFFYHERLRRTICSAMPLRLFPAIGGTSAVAVAAILLYLFVGEVLTSLRWDSRAAMIGPGQILSRLGILWEILPQHFGFGRSYPTPLVPLSSVAIFWIWATLSLTAPLFFRSIQFGDRLRASAMVAVAGGVALPMSVGVLLASEVLWLPPRVLMPVGIIWSAAFLFSWAWSTGALRHVLQVSAWIVVVVFVTKSQEIFLDQWRVNERDRATVMQMVAKLQDCAGWGDVDTVVVVGSKWYFQSAVMTAAGNQNVSVFIEPHGPHAIFSEVTGRSFNQPTLEQRARASSLCDGVHVPREEFEVTIKSNMAIVCRGGY